MTVHYAEAFLDNTKRWGWQCLTPTCRAEVTDLDTLSQAEAGADDHVAVSS